MFKKNNSIYYYDQITKLVMLYLSAVQRRSIVTASRRQLTQLWLPTCYNIRQRCWMTATPAAAAWSALNASTRRTTSANEWCQWRQRCGGRVQDSVLSPMERRWVAAAGVRRSSVEERCSEWWHLALRLYYEMQRHVSKLQIHGLVPGITGLSIGF